MGCGCLVAPVGAIPRQPAENLRVWHWVIHHLVGRHVKQAVYDAATQAAQQKLHETIHEQDTEDDLKAAVCDVAVVFATTSESGGLEDLLTDVRRTQGSNFVVAEGLLAGRRVVVAVSGVGFERARQATSAVILGHRPRWVLSAGFAGGLQPNLAKGDLVMVNQIVEPSGKQLSIDLQIDADQLSRNPGLHVGRILSQDRLVPQTKEKTALGQQYDALSVDMESMVVAEVCRAEQTRFMGIRIISDSVDEDLPPEMSVIVQQGTTVRKMGAAVGSLMRRPGAAKDFLRLREEGLQASDRLAKFLEGVIGQLAPHEDTEVTS